MTDNKTSEKTCFDCVFHEKLDYPTTSIRCNYPVPEYIRVNGNPFIYEHAATNCAMYKSLTDVVKQEKEKS